MPHVRKVEVFRRKGSPFWYVRYFEPTPRGKWQVKWKSSGSKRKADAEKLRREIERDLDAGKRYDADMPWGRFVDDFLEKYAQARNLSAVTHDVYARSLRRFTSLAKPKRLGDVTIGMMEDYASARLALGAAPSTVNKHLRALRAALNWACRRDYINRVPSFAGVFVREPVGQPVTIPETDFVAMVRALPVASLERCSVGWWKVFLYLTYYLGFRTGEILGLTWSRVRFDTLEVVVSAGTSKSKRDRVIPMPEVVAHILKEWSSAQPTISLVGEVLPWSLGTERQLYPDWHAIQDAAGINEHYVPKDMRSSCASELIASGAPTVVVRDVLGHASVRTTERYYINTKPAIRAAVANRKVAVV